MENFGKMNAHKIDPSLLKMLREQEEQRKQILRAIGYVRVEIGRLEKQLNELLKSFDDASSQGEQFMRVAIRNATDSDSTPGRFLLEYGVFVSGAMPNLSNEQIAEI